MAEGFLIMKDVHIYIEKIKSGNFNNFITEENPY